MDDVYEKRKDIFFSNLLLLGFDISYMEKKFGISFNKDMFNVPNQKAFEVVTHFLFTKLNEVSREEYRILWPVLDKVQEREFMKTCKAHLTKISKDNSEFVRFPHVGQILMSPGGSHRFYELYMAFSSFVMQRVIAKDRVCHQLRRPALTSYNHRDVREVLQLSTITASKEFIETQRAAVDCHNEWHDTAQNFVSYYRKTKRQIVDGHKLFKEVLDSLPNLRAENGDIQVSEEEKFQAAFARSGTLLQELTKQWHELEASMQKEKPFWDIIRCALETECPEKVTLDGNKYICPIPDVLKKECRKQLLEHGVQSLAEGDKLSIRSFLNLCYVNMKHYDRLFKEAGLPELEGVQNGIQSCLHKLENILEHTTNLSKNILHEILPHISEEKKVLEFCASACVSGKDVENISKKLPSAVPILSSISNGTSFSEKFQNILHLSPKSEKNFLEFCHQSSEVKSSNFENCRNDQISTSECNIITRLSNLRLPTPREPKTIQKSFSKSTYDLSHIQFGVFSTIGDSAIENDSVLLNCNPDDTVFGLSPKELITPLNRSRTFSAPNSFEESPDLDGNRLNKVHKKFVEHLVNKFKKNGSELASSGDDSYVFPCAINSDILGATAFNHDNKLVRTPPVLQDCGSELQQQVPISSSNSFQGISKGSEISQNSDIEDYRRISWPDDADFLENVTLPDVPILL